ncbi:hypothetical protein CBM2626_B60024 [Cupriavidus taiwanensis]|nr:hypothetical protein CBM2626_B60024 [Cupriavidus taiwanensis]
MRTGNEDMPVAQQAPRHHAFVDNGPHTQRDIDSIFYQVHATFGRVDMDLDVRIALLKLSKQIPPGLERGGQ